MTVRQSGIWRGCPRGQFVHGALRFVTALRPLGIVTAEELDKLELVNLFRLHFLYMQSSFPNAPY